MGSIIKSCMDIVRQLPQGSAIDIPWGWMEEHKLTKESVVSPNFDFTDKDKITQTAARLFFALILPMIAKPFGYANLSLGATHLVCCVHNRKKIHAKEDNWSPQDVESALIRLCTGVYDLGIAYILYSSMLDSIYVRTGIVLTVALLPAYPIQLHHLVFEKAPKTPSDGQEGLGKDREINQCSLKIGCLIKQFCDGLIETLHPAPEVPKSTADRMWALPLALGVWGQTSYDALKGLLISAS